MSSLVYTAGVWDLLHQGHLNLLEGSKALGDLLVVGIVSDSGAAAYKRRPVQPELMRLAIVRALRVVDFAVIQPTTDPTPMLEAIRPCVVTHGDDWERFREGHESLARLGIQFVRLPYTKGISTGRLIRDIAEREAAVHA